MIDQSETPERVQYEKPSPEGGAKTQPTDKKTVLGEGTLGATPIVRFKVDGQVKSLHYPVRGSDLHRVAGNPKSLHLDGEEVKNDAEPVDVKPDAELTTSH